jgi:hypothetical protein
MTPQFLPSLSHVVGVQPHTFCTVPPPHVCGGVQLPHSNVSPQLSETLPQFFSSAAQVARMQPQTPGPPPPQVSRPVQVPQSSIAPQPLSKGPQFLPTSPHVVGRQPQTFSTPPPPHVSGNWQVPHSRVPPHFSSGTVPQFFSSSEQLVGQLLPPSVPAAPSPADPPDPLVPATPASPLLPPDPASPLEPLVPPLPLEPPAVDASIPLSGVTGRPPDDSSSSELVTEQPLSNVSASSRSAHNTGSRSALMRCESYLEAK